MLSRFLRGKSEQRGISQLELIVAAMVLAVLATAVVPLARWDDKRRREARLRLSLEQIRTAIDMYKRYSDEGRILQEDLDQMGYPSTLEELAEEIELIDPTTTESVTMRFMARIPIDPFTEEAVWGTRSYQDDWDSTSWGGENVYDVYSLSPLRALDDTYYSEW